MLGAATPSLATLDESWLKTVWFTIGDTAVTPGTLISVVVVIVATLTTSILLRRAIRAWFHRRGVMQEGSILATERLVHYAVLFIGLGIALQTLGLSLGTLFTAGAVFAVGFGFAMQTIAQNFVSGVILLAERAIKQGDILRLENDIVQVRTLGIRSTIVRTRDGVDLIVPNSVLVQSTVCNYTLDDSRYRVRVRVGVAYSSDLEVVKKALEEAAAPMLGDDSTLQVVLADFGSSSVDFEVALWTQEPWEERLTLSELRTRIWDEFKRRDITIAFPQLDVHFDPKAAEKP